MMALTRELVDRIEAVASLAPGPQVLPWPIPGNPAGFVMFEDFAEWRQFMLRFSLRAGIPDIVSAKFDRALKLYVLGWIDFDLLKAGELVALTALELALRDRYGQHFKGAAGKVSFARLLEFMPTKDCLTDQMLPMIRQCGGSVIDLLTGKRKPSLATIRNQLAHGYPFDGFPQAGLLQLVRDLIEYSYRGWDIA